MNRKITYKKILKLYRIPIEKRKRMHSEERKQNEKKKHAYSNEQRMCQINVVFM